MEQLFKWPCSIFCQRESGDVADSIHTATPDRTKLSSTGQVLWTCLGFKFSLGDSLAVENPVHTTDADATVFSALVQLCELDVCRQMQTGLPYYLTLEFKDYCRNSPVK